MRLEFNQHGREGGAVFTVTEFQATFQKLNFYSVHFINIFVKPFGICPCGQQSNHHCIFLPAFFVCFLHPFPYLSSIRRVHPTSPPPFLQKPVLLGRKVSAAFCIFFGGTNIKCESVLPIYFIKKILRS